MTTVAKPQAGGVAAQSYVGVNIAPMGPIVDPSFTQFIFRPFKTSTTYQNLKATGEGVFHVTDDALMIARGAIGRLSPDTEFIPTRPAEKVSGVILRGACRWYELRVTELDDSEDRTTIRAEAVHSGVLREFIGFNRARHAVVEAAILATRVHLTGAVPVLAEFEKLQIIVDKTGSDREHLAMAELRRAVEAMH